MRWLTLATVALIITIGLLTGIFFHAVAATLSLMPQMAPRSAVMHLAIATPTARGRTAPLPMTPLPNMQQLLAHDTFQRGDQLHWGTASDGQTWQGDANGTQVFSIAGGAGQIANAQGGVNALLGPTITNAEVLFTASTSTFSQTKVNLGATLRWNDADNWYKAYIDGTKLFILKRVQATTTVLATAPFPARANTFYTMRFRVRGTTLSAKVWATSVPEPANWQLTITDASLTSGFAGLRMLTQPAAVIRVTAFLETAV